MDKKAIKQEKIARFYQELANLDAKRQKCDGVVVTPVQVVDFQIYSTIERLKREYNREPDDGVEWLDPFGGSGIYLARLLQIVDLPPERKWDLAQNCAMIEIDKQAAQIAANNLAGVLFEETGRVGVIHVVHHDTFDLSPNLSVWDLPTVLPVKLGVDLNAL